MSFIEYKKCVELGDLVIIYVGINAMYPLYVTTTITAKDGSTVENIVQNRFGALRVADLIGLPYGSRVECSKGYAYVLRPTPELWTRTLPHRTQILYSADISMIILQLDLHPSSVVIESGTGSGSLTHSLARTIAPGGHVYSFDFHTERVSTAKAEFESHGLTNIVTVGTRDVCHEGFGLETIVAADAVFLDLPTPWDAIVHAKNVMRQDGRGRICSFSPCIEQVQKSVESLKSCGFTGIETFECLSRELLVRRREMSIMPDSPWRSKKMDNEDGAVVCDDANNKKRKVYSLSSEKSISFLSGISLDTTTGHTGYLTFATLALLIETPK